MGSAPRSRCGTRSPRPAEVRCPPGGYCLAKRSCCTTNACVHPWREYPNTRGSPANQRTRTARQGFRRSLDCVGSPGVGPVQRARSWFELARTMSGMESGSGNALHGLPSSFDQCGRRMQQRRDANHSRQCGGLAPGVWLRWQPCNLKIPFCGRLEPPAYPVCRGVASQRNPIDRRSCERTSPRT